ncbi:MAG: hypothetical protein LBR05_11565 [Azoarcus sp.]|jgi:hypothetical protein|nr:hypothetical protein [Azoarcus sp.]
MKLDPTAPEGDIARRRAGLFLLLALVATALSVWLFPHAAELWARIAPLSGAAFDFTAFFFGLALAVVPVLAVLGWLGALWFGVASVFAPRSKETPLLDRVIVAIGVVVWFLPALAFVVAAIWSLGSGQVHFTYPARDYFRASDPMAYWEGIGFMFIAAAVFGWGAWRFWQGKLRQMFGGARTALGE